MLTYLDTCIFIYWIEGPAPFDARVRTHLGALQAALMLIRSARDTRRKMPCTWRRPSKPVARRF
jgi:hypothetical protein